MPRRLGRIGRAGLSVDSAVSDTPYDGASAGSLGTVTIGTGVRAALTRRFSESTPRSTTGLSQNYACSIGYETPCKRPRRSKSIASSNSPPIFLPIQRNDLQSSASVAPSILGLITADVLVECLAMLDTQDILQSAMVCSAWQHTANSVALWALAAPRLGLDRRIVQREEISRRMSRGIVRRGVLLGETRQRVCLRTIDLCNSNAGHDDGLLPSIVREASILQLLGTRKHPAIIRFFGAEVDGAHVHIVTEHIASSFEDWFLQPNPTSEDQLRLQVCDRFWQLFKGLGFMHTSGVFHRNLTPANVLLDPTTGIVKICDFAYGRTLDYPLRAYSPEHAKLRPRSMREARRLWYRAPELLLRQNVYGPAIDIWSAGCMFVEAASKDPLFPSEAEIDHLFRIFQMTGTPGQDLWPDAVSFPAFSPRFPVYKPIDFKSVACDYWWSCDDGKRSEVVSTLSRCAQVMGVKGMDLLSDLLKLEPRRRCSAMDAAGSLELQMADLGISVTKGSVSPRHGSDDHPSEVRAGGKVRAMTPKTIVARRVQHLHLTTLQIQSELMQPAIRSYRAQLPFWSQMALAWSQQPNAIVASSWTRVPDAAAAHGVRASQVDSMIQLATNLEISDFALHLSVALLDDYVGQGCGAAVFEDALIAVACLKLAETLDEHSQEYFQRERTDWYLRACGKRWKTSAVVAAEKHVAQRLQFKLHRVTAAWFLRTCAHVGGQRLANIPNVISLACLFLDLSLLHPDSQAHPAPLRGQVALLLAIHVALTSAVPLATASAEVASLWLPVRRMTCEENEREPASRCFDHMVHCVFTLREHLRQRGLHAVEQRTTRVARLGLPPRCIPDDLVEELLPIQNLRSECI